MRSQKIPLKDLAPEQLEKLSRIAMIETADTAKKVRKLILGLALLWCGLQMLFGLIGMATGT